jgi:hypothetical protein
VIASACEFFGLRFISQPQNPRLQRTRSAPLRSPLSRKTFGAAVNEAGRAFR